MIPHCTMASPSTFVSLPLFLFFILFSLHVYAKVVIVEDGFTITTVLDGYKFHINPYSVLQRPGSSDLILLDSVNSIFYTLQFPISKESDVTLFSGNGSPGYSDGDVGSAQFGKPRSFAIDLRGNVYVADRINAVIRKISSKGVSTIAGGFSEKSSRKDGPAQNASFSDNFDVSFIPGLCALLVSDHGYQLVRQINLKEEDCTLGSNSGLGAVMTWTLGLGLSCLLGLVIGIAVRPYIFPHEGSNPCHFSKTWKHCLTNLGKPLPILFSGIKSAAASSGCSSVYTILMRFLRLSLAHLLLMFRINLVSPRTHLDSVSLLDLDAPNGGEVSKSSKYHDQLKDLMCFDGNSLMISSDTTFNRGCDTTGKSAEVMVQANMCNLGIVKRR